MSQPRAGINSQQSTALHPCALASIGQRFERVDDGGESAVSRRSDGIGQRRRHWHDLRARSQHDVAGVAAIQPAAVTERGVAILEKVIAFLRQMPASAGSTVPATVRQRPRHALSGSDAITRTADDEPDRLMPQNTRRWREATAIHGVQVGATDGGQQ